jgi:hypothetical protein
MVRFILGASLLLAILAAPQAQAVPLAQTSSLATVKRIVADAPAEQDIATPRRPDR